MSFKFTTAVKFFTLAIFLLVFINVASAQEVKVDYNNEVIVDSDLDGLTDKGEQQIYQTDPGNQDSDGDGYLDGAEIIAGTDPSDANDYPGHRITEVSSNKLVVESVTPWAWYVSRASGILGFISLWITILLGLSIRNPLLKKIVEPIYSFDLHCFMAASAVFWALVHGTSFVFHDSASSLNIKEISIPYFYGGDLTNANYLALGIMAFYAMAIMTITSYLRGHIKHWLWRALHFLHPLVFVFVVVHGYMIGTDTKNFYIGSAYLFSSFVLVLIYLSSLAFALWNKFKAPSAEEILRNPRAEL